MEKSALNLEKCGWCKQPAKELFPFTWEETGDRDYICEKCINWMERKKGVSNVKNN